MTPLDRVNARANVGNTLPTTAPTPPGGPKSAFSDILRAQMDRTPGVRFSAHAQQRLDSRAISLSPDDQQRISRAVDQAAAKGARESLLLMDNVALVVSVPNRTVITALDTSEAANTVFTNIDSAVVVPGSPASPNTPNPGPDPLRGGSRAADRLMQRAGMET